MPSPVEAHSSILLSKEVIEYQIPFENAKNVVFCNSKIQPIKLEAAVCSINEVVK